MQCESLGPSALALSMMFFTLGSQGTETVSAEAAEVAIVDIKQRNPRYGHPRIAYLIGIENNKDAVHLVLAKQLRLEPTPPKLVPNASFDLDTNSPRTGTTRENTIAKATDF